MAVLIGLDAGHGGSSSGTYSINSTKDGLFEEHYALEIVLLVEKYLNEHGVKTVLTRRTDTNPGNVLERAKMLIEAGCNFCLSIHFNGMSTLYRLPGLQSSCSAHLCSLSAIWWVGGTHGCGTPSLPWKSLCSLTPAGRDS